MAAYEINVEISLQKKCIVDRLLPANNSDMATLPFSTLTLLVAAAMFLIYSPFLFQILYRWIRETKARRTMPHEVTGIHMYLV